MRARPLWTGSISFGLVNVPVKMFSAVRQKELRFHMLHDEDGGRIRQKRVCSADGEEVSNEHIIKGYELSREKNVPVLPKELEKFHPEATHTIDIEDFVSLPEIDPAYFEKTYYLAPDKRAGKAYALLLEALQRSGRVGIAHVVMRLKQYLCAVRPMNGVLALSTMNYSDEIVRPQDIEELEVGSGRLKPAELEMADQLIRSLAGKFDPAKYHDTYREQVLEFIQAKGEGETPRPRSKAPSGGASVNLLEALRRSLAEAERSEAANVNKDAGRKTVKPRAHAAHRRAPRATSRGRTSRRK